MMFFPLKFIYESTSSLSLVKITSFSESTTALFNVCIEYMIQHIWLFTLILILLIFILVIAYYVILLSNEEDTNEYGYRTMLRTVGAREDGNDSPISRKIGAQAAANERRGFRHLDPINYRDYGYPLGLTMDERVRFANLLANSPVQHSLDIDRVFGNIRYKGTNRLLECNFQIFVYVWNIEKNMAS